MATTNGKLPSFRRRIHKKKERKFPLGKALHLTALEKLQKYWVTRSLHISTSSAAFNCPVSKYDRPGIDPKRVKDLFVSSLSEIKDWFSSW
jgi:hypothetical protein